MASTLKVDTITTPDGTGNITFSRPIVGNLTAQKNVIINGDLNIWQRGTSFAAAANNTRIADRFTFFKGGSMVHTISRDTDVPTVAESGYLSNYSLKADCTTASGGIGAADYCLVAYRMEGYDFAPLAQKPMTISFWHKHTKTGTYCVSLNNSGGDRSYVTEYTQTTTDTWEKATVVIPASPSAGTWNYTTSIGVQIQFVMAAGTNYQMTPDAWTAANNFGTSSLVDATDSTSNNCMFAQVQVEAGSVATDFEVKNHADELARCQRYFCKSYNQDTDPETGTETSAVQGGDAYDNTSTHISRISITFPVTMRTTPSIIGYDVVSGTSGYWTQDSTNNDVAVAFSHIGERGCTARSTLTSTPNSRVAGHYTASAEL